MIERLKNIIDHLKGQEPQEPVVKISLDQYYRDKFGQDVILNSRTGRGYSVFTTYDFLRWNPETNSWRKFNTTQSAEMGGEDDQIKVEIRGNLEKDLSQVFLIRGELKNLQHRSPEELNTYIRENIPVETLIERVNQKLSRRKRDSFEVRVKYLVSGWEI